MATVALSSKAVGSTVKLKVNGAYKDFLVVHQGKPSSLYDASCEGTWLLMKDIYEKRAWEADNVNKLESSDIHAYLNNTFINLFEANIRDAIKQVKIPYRKNGGSGGTDQSGANGLSCKIFLLAAYEVGWTTSTSQYCPHDGDVLDYFKGTASTDPKRIAKYNGTATGWWLRSPSASGAYYVWFVYSNGDWNYDYAGDSYGIRPALVLPSNLLVSDDGSVQTNTPPTISSPSGGSGVNLGTKTAGFNFSYTVNDADGGNLTVTEKLDGVTKRSFTAAAGSTNNFECVTAAHFQKVLNGQHTLTVTVSDGKETATFTATFTKSVTKATITLKSPLAVAGDITVAILGVTGSIPSDATYKVEATNNAKDASPVWQDVTNETKSGANIIFNNKVCANGAAFNFRITVQRGVSNTGGFISAVNGAFQ